MALLKKREDLTDSNDDNVLFALGLSNSFGDIVLMNGDKEDNIDATIEEVRQMDLDDETKFKIINEYNNLRNAKSFKEKTKYERNIRALLRK